MSFSTRNHQYAHIASNTASIARFSSLSPKHGGKSESLRRKTPLRTSLPSRKVPQCLWSAIHPDQTQLPVSASQRSPCVVQTVKLTVYPHPLLLLPLVMIPEYMVCNSPTCEGKQFHSSLSPIGPTSLTYILHSSSTMPAVDSFDLRYHQTWRVGRSGEGFIQIHDVSDANLQDDDDSPDGDPSTRSGKGTVEGEVLQELANYFFEHIAHTFPVITKHEFLRGIEEDQPLNSSRPSDSASTSGSTRDQSYEPAPVLLYAICTIAATARGVSARIFDSLRIKLNDVIRSEDIMSTASLTNIQALLIAGMTAEAHGRAPSHAMSTAWLRISAAIRMVSECPRLCVRVHGCIRTVIRPHT